MMGHSWSGFAHAEATEVTRLFSLAQLTTKAQEGKFDEVLESLKTYDYHYDNGDLRVFSLIQDLEHHQQVKSEQTAERLEAAQAAMNQIAVHLNNDELHDALRKGLEAHDLALGNAALLQDPRVAALVAETHATAKEAENRGDWVEATRLYRALDLMFDDPLSLHYTNLKRALKHLRVLRLYCPRRLYDLSVDRAKREGNEDDIEPYRPDNVTWEQRLSGIKMEMFERVLEYAQKKHIDSPPYERLLHGAIDSILVLVNTKELATTFIKLHDQKKVEKFRASLLALRTTLDVSRQPITLGAALINVVEEIIRKNRSTVALPLEVIVYEMTEGAMEELDDFTSVIWPYDKDTFMRSTKGNFFGVGIQISLRDDRLIVVSPLPDTPAYQAGIQAGDIIAIVNGQPTDGWSLDRAVREITGTEGTVVALGIERNGPGPTAMFKIKRSRIEIESVRGWKLEPAGHGQWDYWVDRDRHIAYARLSQFIPKTADGLDEAIERLERDGPLKALILDLRFNPGGLLKSAIDVCDRFIDKGAIVSTVGANGVATGRPYTAQSHHTHRRLPLVVLINEHSASASEIVAGAIQDYGLGTIVGVRSFGKGSVQDLLPLDRHNAYLKLTSQYYKLPLNRIIHRSPRSGKWGIDPDVVVAMTDKQIKDVVEHRRNADVIRDNLVDDTPEPITDANELLTKPLDFQLEAAMLILKTQLLAEHLSRQQDRLRQTPPKLLTKRDELATVP